MPSRPPGPVRAVVLAMVAALPAAGCNGLPDEINPVVIYGEVTGSVDEGRERPPGIDQPYPRLGSIPPRPVPPAPQYRAAIDAALLNTRSESRDPLAPRLQPAPSAAADSPGTPPVPAAPPTPAALRAAPAISWGPEPPRAAAATPAPVIPEPSAPPLEPGLAPAPPPPDLLGSPRTR